MQHLVAATLIALSLIGCDGAGADADGGNGDVTYHRDVAPILRDDCLGCHQEGAIAPLQLTTYEQVRQWGPLVKTATQERRMPPFLPDNSGECATYDDAQWLDDDELETIARWVDTGMAEGDPADNPGPPDPVPTLEVDATHLSSMAEPYIPNDALSDDYRCFLFDDDVDGEATRYVTDYEFVAGDPRVVHHAVIYQPNDAAGVEAARTLDAQDDGPGYECFGGSGISARMLMNWAPGTGITHHPAGTGVELDSALPLLVQLHYNTDGGTYPDQSAIRLKLADSVQYPMRPWFLTDGQLNLPPGEQEVTKQMNLPLRLARGVAASGGEFTIMGVRAHMHQLGTRMRISHRGDTDNCLVDIPRYDFGWQKSYFLEQPVVATTADSVEVTCIYDTTRRDTTVRWGEGTGDEMCLSTFYTVAGRLQ